MRELMREIFSDEIPEYELLEPRIREWLNSSDTDLDNLKDDIFEHLQKHISKNSDLRRKDVGPEAMNLSYSAIDGLIENMEVNSVNFERLCNYVEDYIHLEATEKLLFEFSRFLSPSLKKELLEKREKNFSVSEDPDWYSDLFKQDKIGFQIQGIIEHLGATSDGQLIKAISISWKALCNYLLKNWDYAYEIPYHKWEEIIAAAYELEGYKVVLTLGLEIMGEI